MSTDPTYTETDREEVFLAGNAMARAIADIAHHELADGVWELHDQDTAAEVERLAGRLDQMSEAVREARRTLERAVTGARLRTVWETTLTAHGIPTQGPAEWDTPANDIAELADDLCALREDEPLATAQEVTEHLDNGTTWGARLSARVTPPDGTEDSDRTARAALDEVCAALYPARRDPVDPAGETENRDT